jgi:hypothetical protein
LPGPSAISKTADLECNQLKISNNSDHARVMA